jgi:hypothetical protein
MVSKTRLKFFIGDEKIYPISAMGKLDKYGTGGCSIVINSDHGFYQLNNKLPILNNKLINKFLIDINSLIGPMNVNYHIEPTNIIDGYDDGKTLYTFYLSFSFFNETDEVLFLLKNDITENYEKFF